MECKYTPNKSQRRPDAKKPSPPKKAPVMKKSYKKQAK